MKITSVDRNCWVSINRKDDPGGYCSFDVEAHVDIGHGQFAARNVDLQFFGLADFVADFDAFILDRSRSPRLKATYDSCFTFSTTGSAVLLQYAIGDVFCGNRTIDFHHSGGFEIEQDKLLELLEGFRKLLETQQDD